MPLYPVNCPCGSEEGWSRRPIEPNTTEVECFSCPRVVPIVAMQAHQLAKVHGRDYLDDGVKGRFNKQAGRHFTSRKDMEAWAESRNLEPVSPNDTAWTSIKEINKEHANKDAKAEGFKDQEDRKKTLKEQPEDYLHAAAGKKIDAYHDEHGSAGKKSTDQFLAETNGPG